MREAIALSHRMMEENKGGPFGAVIVRDGEIIAYGWNKVTSENDPTAHAEVSAIREACSKLGTFALTDCDIYTSCEPCPMCLSAIYWARLRSMYYGNARQDAARIGFDDEFLYTEVALAIDDRSLPTVRLLEEEAIVAFDVWEKKPDKVQY
ncbi:MAG: nucleoside deaminase [Alphaproteobacteria bacterium]|nr:nucleoside deaminase [Alphaproteobacteria bacterium]